MIETAEMIREPASFRDPSGFIFERDGCKLRQVNRCYADDYQQLMACGLYEELTHAGLLLPHEEVSLSERASDEAYKVLRPVQLPWISYPYEWSFSQLRDAALVTLEIQQRALAKGMTLKDASAYNIQLYGGGLQLIDTLSFTRYQEGQPWTAYRQFCQHFLAPLALMSRIDVRLSQLLRVHLDGIPLDLASKLLPWRTKFNIPLGLHVHAHARMQQRHANGSTSPNKAPAALSRKKFVTIVAGLQAAISDLKWNAAGSEWSDYYADGHNYGIDGLQAKERLVRQLLDQVKPRTVWDLGANDGRFSRLAVQSGADSVVAWDIDPACVENNYRQMVSERESAIHPLLLDLTNPTPSIGWANLERKSFAARGPVDLLLALGLVHHLAIGNNTPLGQIAAYLASLANWAIVEWIPKEDSQVQRLLSSRDDIFSGYTQMHFESAFSEHFAQQRKVSIPQTNRTLYLFSGLER
jgi:ribosomal protein L11 methylase PrmA